MLLFCSIDQVTVGISTSC